MSTLDNREKRKLEELFGMSSGYVLDFSDRTFDEFFIDIANIDIHSSKYQRGGTSKAKKLREFWQIEQDALVGRVLLALIDHWQDTSNDERTDLAEECKAVAKRMLTRGSNLGTLKDVTASFDAKHLAQQIERMENSVETDPELAIGTAKELIETCCKTILAERGNPAIATPDITTLTKATLKELKLVPEGVPDSARGTKVIKRLLSNLGTIGHGLAELRGLYGTGHGKHGSASGLSARHARLAVGAAATLATFLFDTHSETS